MDPGLTHFHQDDSPDCLRSCKDLNRTGWKCELSDPGLHRSECLHPSAWGETTEPFQVVLDTAAMSRGVQEWAKPFGGMWPSTPGLKNITECFLLFLEMQLQRGFFSPKWWFSRFSYTRTTWWLIKTQIVGLTPKVPDLGGQGSGWNICFSNKSSHTAAAADLSSGNHCSKERTRQTMIYGCLILDFR